MAVEDLLNLVDLPDWLFGPILIVGSALGLALVTGRPSADLLVDTVAWTAACVLLVALVRWFVGPYPRLGDVVDGVGMALAAGVGPVVGAERCLTGGVDGLAIGGFVVGGACALGLVAMAVRRRRRRRR